MGTIISIITTILPFPGRVGLQEAEEGRPVQ